MTIQQTGTRTSGQTIVSGLSSTTNMRVGYYVFGTGIAAGTTIASIDSGTQIHLSGNASSSGSSTVYVSPWYMDTGTIRVPNLTGNGSFRRSRSGSVAVGVVQADQNRVHNHTISGNTGVDTPAHSHAYSGTVAAAGGHSIGDHTHNYNTAANKNKSFQTGGGNASSGYWGDGDSATATTSGGGFSVSDHTHTFSGNTGTPDTFHTHSFSGTTNSDGGGESRPVNVTFLTCVKT